MRRPRHFSRHTSSAGGQAACGCPWDVDTVLWRRHTVAIARMCVCAPDDGRTAVAGRPHRLRRGGDAAHSCSCVCTHVTMWAARSCPSCGLRVMLAALSWRRSRARLLLRACIRCCSGGAQSLAYVRTGCAPGDVRAVLGRIGGDAARSGSCVRVRRRAPGDVRALLGCVVGTCEPPACLAWRKPSTHRLLCM